MAKNRPPVNRRTSPQRPQRTSAGSQHQYPKTPSRAPAIQIETSPSRSPAPQTPGRNTANRPPPRRSYTYSTLKSAKSRDKDLNSEVSQAPSRFTYNEIHRDKSPSIQNSTFTTRARYTGPPTRLYKNSDFDVPTKGASPIREVRV